ncbi:acyl carrier protein [Phytohabitans houttuyneae]|uniref:Carrier domain-containing protein n=1 Tax=Phytohabitans houttuyneae TaxID=1076126 RepID=A0A6V8KAH7_9ACTN|nr:acyl carrier protein [Phytohabitans houttuyneae]GFJ80764.1 hypothetical protein Phou_049440 [Phytohabitans houttuyneae]
MADEKTEDKLLEFINSTLRPKDMADLIEAGTPLIELGILDSLKTAILLNYIRDELGVSVPPMQMVASNFKDVRSIAAMVDALSGIPATDGGI